LSPCYVGLKSPEILYTFRKDFFLTNFNSHQPK
jgi:hypothetical protein